MKQLLALLVAFGLLNLSSIIAQETKDKDIKTNTFNLPNETQATGNTIIMKDEEDNPLMTVTDEGSAGSVTLHSLTSIGSSASKLYNLGGNLYWSGSQLGTGSSNVNEIDDLTDAIYDGASLFLGEGAGINDDGTSNDNTAVGKDALYSNTTGTQNTAIGPTALYSNTTGNYNTANGNKALYSNSEGSNNTAIGRGALYSNTTGVQNTANGHYALYSNTTGDFNTAIGYNALYYNTTGTDNTANGHKALYSNTTRNFNTAIGRGALYSNTTGSGNIALGYLAGHNETGSNKLYIENSTSDTPLIGGDFATDEIYLNGIVGIGTTSPDYKLHVFTNNTSEIAMFENQSTSDPDGIIIKAGPNVNPGNGVDFIMFHDGDGDGIGSIDGNGIGGIRYNTTSDARLKMNIKDYSGGLQTVSRIKVRKYEMKSAPGIESIGLIAQELQEVYPQAVSGSPDSDVNEDPMMIDYGRITPLLIQAIQELQVVNKELKEEMVELKRELGVQKFSKVSN